jgi:hypothetical protein
METLRPFKVRNARLWAASIALRMNAAAPAVSRWIEPAGTANTYSRPASRKW